MSQRSAARIVIVCSLSLFIIFGIRLSFSVFFAEFVLTEGWSNEAAAASFSLNMLCFALRPGKICKAREIELKFY